MVSSIFQRKFEKLAHAYFQKHTDIRVIAVTGSQHTELAEHILASICDGHNLRVRMHSGVYKSKLDVLCGLLGLIPPTGKVGIFEYISLCNALKMRVNGSSDVDIIIQRYDTYTPGDMEWLAEYVRPFVTVLSAIENEPNSAYTSLDEVARERMVLVNAAERALVNHDEVPSRYAEMVHSPEVYTYGLNENADYHYEVAQYSLERGVRGGYIAIDLPMSYPLPMYMVHDSGVRSVVVAATVGRLLGLQIESMAPMLEQLHPLPGRMNIIKGIGDSYIFDVSAGSIPSELTETLRTVYMFDDRATRIAVLGDFNAEYNATPAHYQEAAKMCHPGLLTWVVLIGANMHQYFGPTARQQGCQVYLAKDIIDAAMFTRSVSTDNSLYLVQGSGDLYLEELIKMLADADQYDQLIRQDEASMLKKEALLSRFT